MPIALAPSLWNGVEVIDNNAGVEQHRHRHDSVRTLFWNTRAVLDATGQEPEGRMIHLAPVGSEGSRDGLSMNYGLHFSRRFEIWSTSFRFDSKLYTWWHQPI